MNKDDWSGSVVITSSVGTRWLSVHTLLEVPAFVALAVGCFFGWEAVEVGWIARTWWPHHVAALIVGLVLVEMVTAWIAIARARIRLQFGYDGVTIRNNFRVYRLPWSQVSHLADGSRGGYWCLNVVRRDGRVLRSSATRAEGNASQTTLSAIRKAAELYGVTAYVQGICMGEGVYVDPGGQPGWRYWNGMYWSPILRADYLGMKGARQFPADAARLLMPPMPADGSWEVGVRALRRATFSTVALAVLTAVNIAATIVLFMRAASQVHLQAHYSYMAAVLGLIAIWDSAMLTGFACHVARRQKRLVAAVTAPATVQMPF